MGVPDWRIWPYAMCLSIPLANLIFMELIVKKFFSFLQILWGATISACILSTVAVDTNDHLSLMMSLLGTTAPFAGPTSSNVLGVSKLLCSMEKWHLPNFVLHSFPLSHNQISWVLMSERNVSVTIFHFWPHHFP